MHTELIKMQTIIILSNHGLSVMCIVAYRKRLLLVSLQISDDLAFLINRPLIKKAPGELRLTSVFLLFILSFAILC